MNDRACTKINYIGQSCAFNTVNYLTPISIARKTYGSILREVQYIDSRLECSAQCHYTYSNPTRTPARLQPHIHQQQYQLDLISAIYFTPVSSTALLSTHTYTTYTSLINQIANQLDSYKPRTHHLKHRIHPQYLLVHSP